MHWPQLQSTVQLQMLFRRPPCMIIIHLGGNDLVSLSQWKLIRMIHSDIRYVHSLFPESFLVWSDILPRLHWRGKESTPDNLRAMDLKRKRVNRAGHLAVKVSPKGRYIAHDIDTRTQGLLKNDGTHLTLVGNRIFLLAFEEAIRQFFQYQTVLKFDAAS